jgi:hypothetical protein
MAHPLSKRTIRVLMITANPSDTEHLAIENEMREIDKKIQMSEYRSRFDIRYAHAARAGDLLHAFNRHQPHIVHFSGHGHYGEISLLDEKGFAKPLNIQQLKTLFSAAKGSIRLVILNACHSQTQSQAITSVIDCAIGMSQGIQDVPAIAFIAAFYQALGDGLSLQEAFVQGKAELILSLNAFEQALIPRLLKRKGVDPSRVWLLENIARDASENQITLIRNALTCGDYDSAFRDISRLTNSLHDDLSSGQRAQLKFLEALVHLEGKRPRMHSPSVINSVEGLLHGAGALHRIYSYTGMLAACKYDFAQAGLRNHRLKADQLMKEVQHLLPLKPEDYPNFDLLSRAQPHLYREYHRIFRP